MKKTLLAFALLGATTVFAQDYPSRPVRVVVPYSAGGSSDGPMRVIAQEMSKQLGQQMVVENKPGQGAMLGSAEVVKAPPDGYTLLLASNPNAISASLYSKLTHDPVEDFAPISLLAQEQAVLLVHPSVPARTLPVTATGAQRVVSVPSPSWPWSFKPQLTTLPSSHKTKQ